jgi:hypothetical protein
MGSASAEVARSTRAPAPGATDLLRAALEKIVFFEWRLGELAAELAAAGSRAAAAEQDRERALAELHEARLAAHAAHQRLAEAEAERTRLSSLLARPQPHALDGAALEAERQRSAQIAAELADARREIDRQKQERERWLQDMIAQARDGDEAPAALAQFISEIRAEVISLRSRAAACDEVILRAGLAPPPPAVPEPPPSAPTRESDAVELARRFWAEGRLGDLPTPPASSAARSSPPRLPAAGESFVPALQTRPPVGPLAPPRDAPTDLLPGFLLADRPRSSYPPAPSLPARASAQHALVEQCLRGLAARDPLRRERAARHLAAFPTPAAAPAIAASLGREEVPRCRAAMARALAACGGPEAAQIVLSLLAPSEPPLVRMGALESLAVEGGPCLRAALEAGAADPAVSLRRRTASLALSLGAAPDLLSRLCADPDSSVRAAAGGGDQYPEAPLAEEPAPDRGQETAPAAETASNPTSGRSPPLPSPEEPPPPRNLPGAALHAIRTAIFGLSETELAAAIGLDAETAGRLAEELVAGGLLSRRGRRLVAGPGAESVPPLA